MPPRLSNGAMRWKNKRDQDRDSLVDQNGALMLRPSVRYFPDRRRGEVPDKSHDLHLAACSAWNRFAGTGQSKSPRRGASGAICGSLCRSPHHLLRSDTHAAGAGLLRCRSSSAAGEYRTGDCVLTSPTRKQSRGTARAAPLPARAMPLASWIVCGSRKLPEPILEDNLSGKLDIERFTRSDPWCSEECSDGGSDRSGRGGLRRPDGRKVDAIEDVEHLCAQL